MNEPRAVIFDFNRTLYDPLTDALYPGVPEMLDELKGRNRLILWSKRGSDRGALMRRLGIDGHFEACYFVDKKTPEDLRKILDEQGLVPEHALVVGDLIEGELMIGRDLGLDTVWARHGIFAAKDAELMQVPTYVAGSIEELRELLKTIG